MLDDGVSIVSASARAGPVHLSDAAGCGDAGGSTAASLTGYGHSVIRLSKKTGLPVGIRLRGGDKIKEAPLVEAGEGDEEGADEASQVDGNSDSDDQHPHQSTQPSLAHQVRNKDETPAERRARKAATKADARVRREAKKALKQAYKAEEARQAGVAKAREGLARGVIISAM